MQQSKILMLIVIIFNTLGTTLVHYIELSLISKLLPFAMMIICAYFLFSKKISDDDRTKNPHKTLLYITISISGFYGGLLGVGIGSFILAIFVSIGDYGLSKAVAHSRWIVFSVNIASVCIFVISENILYALGITMCIGQII